MKDDCSSVAMPESDPSVSKDRLRELALNPGPERDLLYEQHPVVLNAVKIATKPVQEAYDIISQVVVHRDPGTCLIADFRFGKTTTVAKIIEGLSETFPNLSVGRVIAKGHDISTERMFYTDLLTDFKHSGARTGTTSDRRSRILNLILALAKRKNSDRYLLLVDEGQNWGEMELQILRDLTNDLQAADLTVITVIFGHPELYNIRSRLLNLRRTDLIGRFLLTPREFRGLRDRDELVHTLQAYDDPLQHQYPLRSDISYSEFFMPVAWRSGWRLVQEADEMWDALSRIAVHANRSAKNIGMNWIGGSVRNFLFSQASQDGSGFAGKPSVWTEAVEASGYEASLV